MHDDALISLSLQYTAYQSPYDYGSYASQGAARIDVSPLFWGMHSKSSASAFVVVILHCS